MNNRPTLVIEPEKKWQFVNIKELIDYRDLFFSLVWRNIKGLYAQTIMGFLWAFLQPLIQIAIFTLIFGRVARLPTDGIPYLLFSSVAVIPWTYLSQSISQASQSLVTSQAMLGKIYFPRIIFPITPILAKLVDFCISMFIIIGVSIYFKVPPTLNLLMFPFLVLLMMGLSSGIGFWLSSLAIRFRDVQHAMPFMIRMAMYTAPIVYSSSSIPETYRMLYSFNPIVGIIEGFRSCFLGTDIPWPYIMPGVATNLVILLSGVIYFKRTERIFVDVI